MEHRVIKDSRGRVPNIVIDGKVMRHQPSGLEVEVPGRTKRDIRTAQQRLLELVRASQ